MSGIDSCLKIAKLTAAAGEFAPFPFIKGAAQCVVVVLEIIESAAKNGKDLQELAESTVATLVVVRDTIIDHGPTSASCFKDICLDFQTYLNDLLSKLNKEGKPSGIRRLLKAKKISEDISAYRQRVQTAKDNFLIRTMTMTHLTLSDVRGDVTAGFSTLTGSMEASERNITSIKDNVEEIRTLGVQQNENIENLSTRLLQASRQRGRDLYKETVWNIIPGDIRIIKRVTRSSRCYCTRITYKDSHCTVENSNTPKIIRQYQAHSNNGGGDAMDLAQFDQALDFFMKQRHPNLPQIFGVCRSPDFPAIIFHGTTRVPFSHYLHDSPRTRVVEFFSELFQDLQSFSEVLLPESYRVSGDRLYSVYRSDNREEEPYVNEHGKLVFGDLQCYTAYVLDPFKLSYLEHAKYSIITSRFGEPFHSQASRWMLSSSPQMGGLQHRYEALAFCHGDSLIRIEWTQTFNRYRLHPPQCKLYGPSDSDHDCPYRKGFCVPGSILSDIPAFISKSPRRFFVGRVQPSLHRHHNHWFQCHIRWEKPQRPLGEEELEEVVELSFENGSVSIELSWDDVIRDPIISIHTHYEDFDEIVKSWMAQTSKLDSCFRSRGYYGDGRWTYIITDVIFRINLSAKDHDKHDLCRVCNAEDRYHHALSLSITAPAIDHETNTIKSWPDVSCSPVCGVDFMEEENIFTIEVCGNERRKECRWYLSDMARLTIPELNAKHGFDPAHDGADVCEYFGWPLLEIFDPFTGEWMLNSTASQSSGPTSVTSDNTDPILSQECDSTPRGKDVTTRSITEEVQAGEAPTKTESVPVVRYKISTRSLIIIFIAIGVQIILLSSFKNYL
ncbi:hypothetical protein EDD85DRAFT_958113 [Armillaria nabsnona]|nr:hypothetical protein EDD85DRAFT_958113 [Armillaria nabsnona]